MLFSKRFPGRSQARTERAGTRMHKRCSHVFATSQFENALVPTLPRKYIAAAVPHEPPILNGEYFLSFAVLSEVPTPGQSLAGHPDNDMHDPDGEQPAPAESESLERSSSRLVKKSSSS